MRKAWTPGAPVFSKSQGNLHWTISDITFRGVRNSNCRNLKWKEQQLWKQSLLHSLKAHNGLRHAHSSSLSSVEDELSVEDILQKEFGISELPASGDSKVQDSDLQRNTSGVFVSDVKDLNAGLKPEVSTLKAAVPASQPHISGIQNLADWNIVWKSKVSPARASKEVLQDDQDRQALMRKFDSMKDMISEIDGATKGIQVKDVASFLLNEIKDREWSPEFENHLNYFQIELDPMAVEWVLRMTPNVASAWNFFKWAARKRGYRHNSRCYSTMIFRLGNAKMYELLEQLVDDMDRRKLKMPLSLFNCLIEVYGTPQKIHKAEECYRKLGQLGLSPNSFTYKCILQAYVKAGQPIKAYEIYRMARFRQHVLDNSTFNLLLDGLGKQLQVEPACKVFDDMKKLNFTPDTHTYTFLIRMFASAGMVDRCLGLFDEMKARGCKPNVAIFNILLNALLKEEMSDTCFKIFKKMLKDGLCPNHYTCSSVVLALRRVGQLHKVHELLSVANEDIRKETYESFINSFGKMGYVKEVGSLFKRLQQEGYSPNAATYATMIDCFCRAGDLEQAMSLVKKMEQIGCRPSTVSFNMIMSTMRKNGKVDDALSLLEQMKKEGPSPSTISYNIIITGLSKVGKLQLASKLFGEMEKMGCRPNAISYNSLIHAFSRRGDTDSTNQLLLEMEGRGISPNVVTYNSVIEGLTRSGKPDTALDVFNKMTKKGCSPSFITYNNLLLCLARAGRKTLVLSLFEQMKQQGCLPDALTFDILDNIYKRDPTLDRMQLQEDFQKGGFKF